jgi:hypothetical protein
MALDPDQLTQAILNAMNSAETQGWSKQRVAEEWANAIHAYVLGAEVQGVACSVAIDVPLTGPSPAHATTTAHQTGSVGLS